MFFLCLLFKTSALAVVGQAGTDIAILNAGVGARALGMGSAFTAVADNADAPYWNPAGLAQVTSYEITTMQTKLSTDADHYYVSYVNPLWGGTLGISWIQIGSGILTQTSREVDSHNEVQNLSTFSSFANAYLLSYGKNLNDHVAFGLTAKYLTSDMTAMAGGRAYGYSISPGLMLRGMKDDRRWTIGIKIDELLNEQQWGTGTVEKVSPKLRLGVAMTAGDKGTLAVDMAQMIRPGYAALLTVGYEWAKEGLSLRIGYNDGLTAGAGFVAGPARVDYAYVTQQELSKDNVHRVSLSGMW